MKKEEVKKIIISIWLVAMSVYFVNDIWQDYKVRGIKEAYQKGIDDMASQIINEVEKGSCESFEISANNQKVTIMGAECLSQINENN